MSSNDHAPNCGTCAPHHTASRECLAHSSQAGSLRSGPKIPLPLTDTTNRPSTPTKLTAPAGKAGANSARLTPKTLHMPETPHTPKTHTTTTEGTNHNTPASTIYGTPASTAATGTPMVTAPSTPTPTPSLGPPIALVSRSSTGDELSSASPDVSTPNHLASTPNHLALTSGPLAPKATMPTGTLPEGTGVHAAEVFKLLLAQMDAKDAEIQKLREKGEKAAIAHQAALERKDKRLLAARDHLGKVRHDLEEKRGAVDAWKESCAILCAELDFVLRGGAFTHGDKPDPQILEIGYKAWNEKRVSRGELPVIWKSKFDRK